MAVIISDSSNTSYGTSVETFTIANGGADYVALETLTLDGGDSGCTITIDTVDGDGAILTASLLTTGSGYALSTYDGTGGSGTGAQFTVATMYSGFSTTDGFYRVEASNMGLYGASLLALTSARYENITFSNAGNCLGVVHAIGGATSSNTKGVIASLEEYQSVTSFDTGTERVNKVAHGLNDNDIVSFTTTGVLPTGITAGVQYYVVNKNADDFQISTTLGGSAVLLSGSPSGTWTVGVERATKTLSVTDLSGPADTYPSAVYAAYGMWCTPFVWTSSYAVTTTPSIYRIRLANTVSGTGGFSVKTSDSAITMAYAVWCDNKVSYSPNDIVVVKNSLVIDQDVTLGGALGTGEATCGTSGWVCSKVSDPITTDNICLLTWQNPPLASYTFTLKGRLYFGTLSGFRAGTSTYRIPYSEQAIITITTPAVGTLYGGFSSISWTAVASGGVPGWSLFLYGEIPTYQKTNLVSNASTGQPHLLCTDNVDWGNGDQIIIGKSLLQSQGDVAVYTVQSVSGNDITLTGNVSTTRVAGGTIVRLSKHGIILQNDVSYVVPMTATPLNFILSGVYIYNYAFATTGHTSYYYWTNFIKSSLRSQFVVQDCAVRSTSVSMPYWLAVIIPPDNMLIQRVYTTRVNLCYSAVSYFTTYWSSGRLTIRDSAALNLYSSALTPSTNSRVSIINNRWENSRVTTANTEFVILQGIETEFYDNYFWGNGTGVTAWGAVTIWQLINPISIGPNYYDYNTCALTFGAYASRNCMDDSSAFGCTSYGGTTYANTTDIALMTGAIPDYIFKDVTYSGSDLIFDLTYIEDMVVGTKIAFPGYGDTPCNDWTLQTFGRTQRTGDSLSDTTVHTSGSGKYALRMYSTSVGGDIEFSQIIPTGDISGLTMVISVWVKINSSNFYVNVHKNPTLSVDYDNGTIVTTEATDTTDWQLLTLSFTPTTSFGRIEVTIGGYTDATGSDAYFYVDDISSFYPPGITLSLGGLDLWADALPVTPSISTGINAMDVWSVQTSTLDSVGTVGKEVADKLPSIETKSKIIQALVS